MLSMEVEDVDSGQIWPLVPERMGVEGGMFDQARGESRLYAGMLDEGRLEWHLVVARSPVGRRIVQGRIRSFTGPPRRFRWRVGVAAGPPTHRVLQDSHPTVLLAVRDQAAVAVFVDVAEPRRHRALPEQEGRMGFEFDLAVTRATGNFPRSATFSIELDAWPSLGFEQDRVEALSRLSRYSLPSDGFTGGGTPDVEALIAFEPSRHVLEHPGGFRDPADALHYLMLRTSGLFRNPDWAASAFLSAALDVDGQPLLQLQGEQAILSVNVDPDLDGLLQMGQNRGLTTLGQIQRTTPTGVWIRAAGEFAGLDYSPRALRLCDYPALWREDFDGIGVDLRHAEVELIASLACVLRERGIRLWVSDPGPMAPFTLAQADGVVCESVDPDEMRRQRAMAGTRPIWWAVRGADTAAQELARQLDFLVQSPPGQE